MYTQFDATVDVDADERGLTTPSEIMGITVQQALDQVKALPAYKQLTPVEKSTIEKVMNASALEKGRQLSADEEREHAELLKLPPNQQIEAFRGMATVASMFEEMMKAPVKTPPATTEEAVAATIKKARDSRSPAPRMKAVDADEPSEHDEVSEELMDYIVGMAECCGGKDLFPLTTKLLQRFGAGQGEPRYIRIDTEKTYKAFRAESSPELAALRKQVQDLNSAFKRHAADPFAHQAEEEQEELLEELDLLDVIGAEAMAAEKASAIEMWLPKWAEGKVRSWREGGMVCASISLPGSDGQVRICTSMAPMMKFIDEMGRHADEAEVVGADILGVLPEMGCVLGAGTLVKEMAAAAPAILSRPEAAAAEPFVCKIEPKAKPGMAALIALWQECCYGNKQACNEWNSLAAAARKGGAEVVAKAMVEAASCFKKATA